MATCQSLTLIRAIARELSKANALPRESEAGLLMRARGLLEEAFRAVERT